MATRTFSELLGELPEGRSPRAEWVNDVLRALRPVLATELRRRNLWSASPRHLGVPATSWTEGLAELSTDAYAFIFVERLSALRAQLRVRPNIDGVVLASLRNFLHERQRDNDRLGYQVFDVLRTALAARIAARELWVLSGDPEIRNDTLLAFDPAEGAEPAAPAALSELARAWNDTLLPDLIAAHGAGRVAVLERLRRLIAELPERGVRAFVFRDLIGPLKADLRHRWAATLEHEGASEVDPEDGSRLSFPFAKPVDPRQPIEERDRFTKLANCVGRHVEGIPEADGLRRELEWVWGAVRAWVHDATAPERPPSVRGLAALFGLTRERVAELLAKLATFLRACQEILAGRVAEFRPKRGAA